MTMSKMVTPRLAVLVEKDGTDTEYVVQTDNRDAVRFDMLRGRKDFPLAQDAPMLWMSVLAWSALNREGKIGADVMHALENELISVVPVDADGNEVTGDITAASSTVDPTPTGRQPAA